MNEGISRRNFLKAAGAVLGTTVLPDWITQTPESEMLSVQGLLKLLDQHDADLLAADFEGWREDLVDCQDFDQALNLSYSYLVSSGVDAFEFFVEQGWFLDE